MTLIKNFKVQAKDEETRIDRWLKRNFSSLNQNFIEKNLSKEINFFKKRYKIEFNITADPSLILPEYRIDLFNKNKKLLNKIESIEETEIKSTRSDYSKNHFEKNRHSYKKKFNKRNKFKKRGNFRLKMKKGGLENKKLLT